MKKLISILFIAFIAISTLIAQTFEIGGINYIVTSPNTVEVIAKTPLYEGDIVIPSQVTYNDTDYAVTEIGDCAFCNCVSLTSITIPNSVTIIKDYAFLRCSSLISINISNSALLIEEYAFYKCDVLKEINVAVDNPNYASVDGVLYDKNIKILIKCPTTKTSITIPNSVTTIGNYAFYNCQKFNSIIPNSVTTIGNYAFYSCQKFNSIIPNSVTSIGDYAFYYCRSLTSINIPNSVISIGNYAFQSCYKLNKLTIGNSITSIGYNILDNCSNLKQIICYALYPPKLRGYSFGVSKSIPVYVHKNCINDYTVLWIYPSNVFAILEISDNKTICRGQSVSLYADGANTYKWSNGDTTNNIIVRPSVSTKYYVTGYYQNGQDFTDSVLVTVKNDRAKIKDMKITQNKIFCKNIPFDLNVDGGHTYQWSNGSTSQSIEFLAEKSGYYYVTVTDTINCYYDIDSVYIKVINNCSVDGQVFYDINQNQVWDYFEKGFKGIKIKISPGGYAVTDNYGKFISNPLKTNCEVSLELDSNSIWELTTPQSVFNINYDDTGSISRDIIFGIKANRLFRDFEITIFSDIHRNGRPVNHYVNVKNKGTVEGKTTVEYTFNPNILTFESCDNCENLNINGGLISFDTDTININDSRKYTLSFTVKVGATGQKVFTYACSQNNYFGELEMKRMNTNNNCDTLTPMVIASYDPNDKQAQWAGMNSNKKYVGNDKTVRYTIRFQNTGNDTAFDIWIADTLSKLHDYSSIDVLASSHDVVTLLDSNGVLKFFFYDIMLPDSNVNEKLSHGFVSFSIRLQDTIAECTEVRNKVGIFFDFNDPVITNEVSLIYSTLFAYAGQDTTIKIGEEITLTANSGNNYNYKWSHNRSIEQSITVKPAENTTYKLTVSDQYGCYDSCSVSVLIKTADAIEKFSILNYQLSINIFPNPANDILNITTTASNAKNLAVDIYGKLIMKEQLIDNLQLDIKHLESGIYFIKIENKTLKFIKQ